MKGRKLIRTVGVTAATVVAAAAFTGTPASAQSSERLYTKEQCEQVADIVRQASTVESARCNPVYRDEVGGDVNEYHTNNSNRIKYGYRKLTGYRLVIVNK